MREHLFVIALVIVGALLVIIAAVLGDMSATC